MARKGNDYTKWKDLRQLIDTTVSDAAQKAEEQRKDGRGSSRNYAKIIAGALRTIKRAPSVVSTLDTMTQGQIRERADASFVKKLMQVTKKTEDMIPILVTFGKLLNLHLPAPEADPTSRAGITALARAAGVSEAQVERMVRGPKIAGLLPDLRRRAQREPRLRDETGSGRVLTPADGESVIDAQFEESTRLLPEPSSMEVNRREARRAGRLRDQQGLLSSGEKSTLDGQRDNVLYFPLARIDRSRSANDATISDTRLARRGQPTPSGGREEVKPGQPTFAGSNARNPLLLDVERPSRNAFRSTSGNARVPPLQVSNRGGLFDSNVWRSFNNHTWKENQTTRAYGSELRKVLYHSMLVHPDERTREKFGALNGRTQTKLLDDAVESVFRSTQTLSRAARTNNQRTWHSSVVLNAGGTGVPTGILGAAEMFPDFASFRQISRNLLNVDRGNASQEDALRVMHNAVNLTHGPTFTREDETMPHHVQARRALHGLSRATNNLLRKQMETGKPFRKINLAEVPGEGARERRVA